MQQDIFKRFKNSIEKVLVSGTPRGKYDNDQPTTGVELECIIKRKSGMTQSTQNSEDRESRTNFHFRPSDMEYIKVGSYIKLDGYWRSIEDLILARTSVLVSYTLYTVKSQTIFLILTMSLSGEC